MKIKANRVFSFAIIIAVYAMATAVGIICFNAFNDMKNLFFQILVADVIATAVVFFFSLILKNASVYDPYWSVQPIVICCAFAIGRTLNLFQTFMLAVICLWGIRLTLNWAYTFKNLNHQDWRYTMLKEKTGIFYPLVNFLGIHMFPTIVVWGVCLPAVVAFVVDTLVYTPLSIVCLCISVFAVVLQFVSDMQMHQYRKNRDTAFIRNGLWKYSRHPNYLGEILMWWGVALSVYVCNFANLHLLLGALVNTLMFVFISIPMADKRQAKKSEFETYKKQTRMLFPIKRF